MKLKYKVLSSIWIVLIAICLFTFYSYAMWVINLQGEEENTIVVTCFNTSFSETSGTTINLYNTYPVSSERALRELNPYVFTITNNCTDTNITDYMVTLNRVNNDMGDAFVRVLILDEAVNFNTLTSEQIASYVSQTKIVGSLTDITNDDNVREFLNFTPVKSYQLDVGALNANETKTYYLYAWIDSAATQSDVGGKKYEASIDVITYSAYHEPPNLALETLQRLQTLNSNLTLTESTTDNPDFSLVSPPGEYSVGNGLLQTSGLYESVDDYGKSYYFRGDITNNYVEFGSWQTDWYIGYKTLDIVFGVAHNQYLGLYTSLADCENALSGDGECEQYNFEGSEMFWRIVRINGDGSIRMIYDGNIGIGAYNAVTADDNAYAGYMTGTPNSNTYEATHANINNSTIKNVLDNWYQTQLSGYSSYVSDTLFCSDRSLADANVVEYISDYYSREYTTNAYGTNSVVYASYGRLFDEFRGEGNKATLKCKNKNDRFTVSDTRIGNGALTYPIGLITADEVNMAGEIPGYVNDGSVTTDNYLKIGESYWTMSPGVCDSGNCSLGQAVNHGGSIMTADLASDTSPYYYVIRPVINLKGDVIISGTGTDADPFVVE